MHIPGAGGTIEPHVGGHFAASIRLEESAAMEHQHHHRIAEIKGLDVGFRTKLAAMSIHTVEDLLERAADGSKRASLAKGLGVESAEVTEWVNRADLMRLRGVGMEMANLLEVCGVDSCKELQHRVAENLYAKLKTTNDAERITHHAPSLRQVTSWVIEAKRFVKA